MKLPDPFGDTPPPARTTGLLRFCPHYFVDAAYHMKVEDLQKLGVTGVILDLDNTLVRWKQEEVSQEMSDWIAVLQGAGMRLCFLSNSIWPTRSRRLGEKLSIANVGWARKPGKAGFYRALQVLGTAPQNTVIIGDQLFTDIWGGNRMGMYTVLVQPIHPGEFIYTRLVSRPIERFLLRLFRKRGHLPPEDAK